MKDWLLPGEILECRFYLFFQAQFIFSEEAGDRPGGFSG
jgi:hypothetical protein